MCKRRSPRRLRRCIANVGLILLEGGVVETATRQCGQEPSSLVRAACGPSADAMAACEAAMCDARPESVQGERMCERCRRVSYCSRECLRGQWAGHKAVCSLESNMLDEGYT